MAARSSRDDQALTELGKRIQQLREAAGMTQPQLADEVGVAAGTLRNWEQGRRDPGTANLKKIAAILGVEAGELLKSPDPSVPSRPVNPGRPRLQPPDSTESSEPGEAESKPAGQADQDAEPKPKKRRKKKGDEQ